MRSHLTFTRLPVQLATLLSALALIVGLSAASAPASAAADRSDAPGVNVGSTTVGDWTRTWAIPPVGQHSTQIGVAAASPTIRHVVLRGDEPIVAARTDELLATRDRAGLLGVQLYEAVHGVPAEGVVDPPSDAIPVRADEFDRVFRQARAFRNRARTTTGPFPCGSLVQGTFRANPWPAGTAGTYVDIGHEPIHGFVDAMWFFQNRVSWPEPGIEAQFRVVGVRLQTLQMRLEPTCTDRTGP
ncbi:hypothetical protein [Promicromonospora sp. NPDC019610]|uniref:hypothetical protein n=1 Tax=Promicromonospora sp. NPDC019610 TaxID=3364405 RepID=UPI0037A7B74B